MSNIDSEHDWQQQQKVKVKVSTLDIAPLRGTPPQKRSGTDHTVLPANFTVPASTS